MATKELRLLNTDGKVDELSKPLDAALVPMLWEQLGRVDADGILPLEHAFAELFWTMGYTVKMIGVNKADAKYPISFRAIHEGNDHDVWVIVYWGPSIDEDHLTPKFLKLADSLNDGTFLIHCLKRQSRSLKDQRTTVLRVILEDWYDWDGKCVGRLDPLVSFREAAEDAAIKKTSGVELLEPSSDYLLRMFEEFTGTPSYDVILNAYKLHRDHGIF